jgi:hypothetical protein
MSKFFPTLGLDSKTTPNKESLTIAAQLLQTVNEFVIGNTENQVIRPIASFSSFFFSHFLIRSARWKVPSSLIG